MASSRIRSLASTHACTPTRWRWADSPSQLPSWLRMSCGAGCEGGTSGWTKLACTNWGSPGAYKRGRRAISWGLRANGLDGVPRLYK
ncbi:Uncharacterised protein [Bordetella pertussis]|nr:Uncharacterised protein [Bordetella pertussis]